MAIPAAVRRSLRVAARMSSSVVSASTRPAKPSNRDASSFFFACRISGTAPETWPAAQRCRVVRGTPACRAPRSDGYGWGEKRETTGTFHLPRLQGGVHCGRTDSPLPADSWPREGFHCTSTRLYFTVSGGFLFLNPVGRYLGYAKSPRR